MTNRLVIKEENVRDYESDREQEIRGGFEAEKGD